MDAGMGRVYHEGVCRGKFNVPNTRASSHIKDTARPFQPNVKMFRRDRMQPLRFV
jgi:hypothetical protein